MGTANSENGVRLFRAYSVMARYRGHKDVSFQWRMLNRVQSVAPYAELIVNYEILDRLEQLHLENFLDEAFTAEEIVELRNCLSKIQQASLQVEELSLPLRDTGVADPQTFLALSRQEIHLLGEDEDYDLPFQVYGRYDLSQHEVSEEDPEEAIRLGAMYLQEGLKALGIAAEQDLDAASGSFSAARLTEVALKLREERGLEVSLLRPRTPAADQAELDELAYILKAYLPERP
jgi:hypothetical protein